MRNNLQALTELVVLYCFWATQKPKEDTNPIKFEDYRRKPSLIRAAFPSNDTLESLNDVRTWR